ncbi:MAG: IS701 family transposase [Desulfobacteraceae bacterium]|nr:IS701 family transposase [Desulfobacteraceae bacterium]
MKSFSHHFQSYRHNVTDKARQYASGLMQAGSRKNMDRMAEVVPDSKSRNLQQFLTHSKWSAEAVIGQVAGEANALLGDAQQAGLLIGESGFAKQGPMSVGVSRQWLGRLGKVDNGQVAVFGVLGKGRFAIPVDVRLYLPRSWTEDPQRCEKGGIPEAQRVFRTKDELAIEIVRSARKRGLCFGWVGADGGYGKGPGFCMALDRMGERFVVDLHSDFTVYLDDPAPYIPEKRNKRGRQCTRYRTDAKSYEVKEVVELFKLSDQPVLKLRKTSRGPLKVRALRVPVYVWDGESSSAKRYDLIATRTLGKKPETKISLSNADETIDLQKQAWMQLQRYWIERAFEDAKSECGMADYQVRKWSAWHHHMALVMMAMLFMLNERIRHKKTYPLLSCSDIEELLSHFLPRRDVSEAEVIRQLEDRHRRRLSAIKSHTRNQGKRVRQSG